MNDQKLGAAEIATLIRRDIVAGTMQRHDRLPSERRLADDFGVARNTVREAINRLAQEHYVDVRAGSGTYVTFDRVDPASEAMSSANPLELIDTRFALEPHICRLCVLHGRRSDFETLESLCIQMEHCRDDALAFADADTAFHRVLAEATGNRLLQWVIGQINSVRSQDEWTLMRQLTLDRAMIDAYNVQHREILMALRDREPERAANAMKEHLESARLSLTRAAAT